MDERLARYVTDLFAPEDAALAAIRRRHAEADLPDILISADEESQLGAGLLRHGRVCRHVDDRREHAVDVEQDRCTAGVGREPLER